MFKLILPGLCFLLLSTQFAHADVANTVHNLSVTGPGQIKSQTEDRICIYCHIPHSATADAPLWNRNAGGGHIPYQSSTLDASPGVLTYSTVHCLSCHDGTIALGNMAVTRTNTAGTTDNLNNTTLTGRASLGTNLSDDHPVSISYDSTLATVRDTSLVHPSSIDLPLQSGELHCTSCHDSHDNTIPPFLHKSTTNGELCLTCHTAEGVSWSWLTSAHATSTATPQGAVDPWSERKDEWKGSNVSENACMNCHTPHNAAEAERLIKDVEENTCYQCHDGSVAQTDIQAEFQRFYRHPVDVTPNPDHGSAIEENPATMALHAECADCHNSHASYSGQPMISFNPASPLDGNHSTAPAINGHLAGVTGIDISGNFKQEAEFEYEVCFKCHGVSGKSACDNGRCSSADGYQMVRGDGVYNIREKFDPGNPALQSYHPVYANDASNNSSVPSLRNDIPLDTVSSLIYCGDCHNSNGSEAAGGTGAAGAHGSDHEGMLALRNSFDPIAPSTNADNALCFKCHSSATLQTDTTFPHKKHIADESLGCINCHDPHGSTDYPHLINFLTTSNVAGQVRTITGTGAYAEPTWIDLGQHNGQCYLSCHGVNHPGWDY